MSQPNSTHARQDPPTPGRQEDALAAEIASEADPHEAARGRNRRRLAACDALQLEGHGNRSLRSC